MADEWSDARGVDWQEADRFDRWVRRYSKELREYVATRKHEDITERMRGISIISRLYERTGGAAVL